MRTSCTTVVRLLLLALLVTGCSDEGQSAEDAAARDSGQLSDAARADSQDLVLDQTLGPDAAADSGLEACEERPAGFCLPETAQACLDAGDLCRCVSVCSGVQPPPGEEYSWECAAPPDPRCPATAPAQNAACPAEGLTCLYGSCGGVSASCTASGWLIEAIQPPP